MAAVKSDNQERAQINKWFVINVVDTVEGTNKLVGAGKYAELVGEEIKIKHFKRVLEGGQYQYTFKLRRGLTINFRSK